MKSEKYVQEKLAYFQAEKVKEDLPPFAYNVLEAQINLCLEILNFKPGIIDNDNDEPPVTIALPRPMPEKIMVQNFVIYPSGSISIHTVLLDENEIINEVNNNEYNFTDHQVSLKIYEEFAARYEED